MCDADEFKQLRERQAGIYARIDDLKGQIREIKSALKSQSNDQHAFASKVLLDMKLLQKTIESQQEKEQEMLQAYQAIAGFVKVVKWFSGIALFMAAMVAALKTGFHWGGK